MKPVQSFFHQTAGAGNVHSQKMLPAFSVLSALRKIQPCFLPEISADRFTIPRQTFTVKPHQISSLGTYCFDLWQILVYKFANQLFIPRNILPQGVQPGIAFCKSSHSRIHRKCIRLRNFIRIQGPPHFMPQSFIRYYNRRSLEPRQIKRLCRGDTGHADLPAYFGNRCEGNIASAGNRQITMDLIGYHRHMIPRTQFPDFGKCLFVPYFPHRIVGIAEDHQCCLRVCQFSLQFRPVNRIVFAITIICERRLYNISSVIDNRIEENIVDRRLYQHIFPCCRQLSHRA